MGTTWVAGIKKAISFEMALGGGHCRIRTCDPLGVNQVL